MEAVKTATRMMMLAVLMLAGLAAAQAQDARLQFTQLDKLASKADNVVEVTLDKNLLQVAAKFLSDKNPTEAAVKDLVSKLQGVYVRVFEFDKIGEYSLGDVEPIRSQVNAPGWSKIVGVMSRREGQKVDVHLRMDNAGMIHGLLILATQPRELVVVNIVGPIDLEKLSQLEGQFGIPKLELDKIKAKPRNE
ncbi:MAG: DUF4252 domain-containing protein [Acidobacteriota bacterium]|nr:DUF4252 domain-containing protein [Acidobacteriota bacterium]